MKVYTLIRTQVLPISITEAWEFFSSPKNLEKITPSKMNFRILHISGGDKAYPGQIIRYKVKALPLISVTWVTEITYVQEPHYFVDDQRVGPFAIWHHQHSFREVENGVEMTDEVTYGIPFGPLGTLAHWLFVKRDLNTIFSYRYEVLERYFNKRTNA
ncbi:MAG: SRPBCC family protein [Cyclobacteriaceae bacterium]|nr:SRPBCC family protein [Cyclobacteriaceae bacterium]